MHIQFAEAGFLPAAFKTAGRAGAILGRRFRSTVGLLLILAMASIIGCKPSPPPPPKPLVANSTDPQWVSQGTPHAKVAVVFVHGIFGDTLGTWTNKNGETFFRLLKTQPRVADQVDIFAFGFTSNMFKPGSLNIREAANRLHESLQYKEVLGYPAVVFVAHSMGGLVVLDYLLGRRKFLEKVPLLVFYATPQEGSQITEIARHVAKNPALAGMLPADKNDYLQRLNDQWRLLPNRPPIVCAYEKLETDGVLIVPWSSATRFCNDAPPAIEADHIRIVKPDRLEHPSLVVLVNALNQHVMGEQLTAKLDDVPPDLVRNRSGVRG